MMIDSTQQSVIQLLAFQSLWNGQAEKAEALYSLLLTLTPDAVRVRTGLACAQLHNHKAREALASLAPLAEMADPSVQLLLAQAFTALGETGYASKAMKRFCSTRPTWRNPVLIDSLKNENNIKGVNRHAR